MTFEIPIHLNEQANIERHNEMVNVGVPFAIGQLSHLKQLLLCDDQHQPIDFHSEITARWHDQSIRWIQLYFPIHLKAHQHRDYYLTQTSSDITNPNNTQQKIETHASGITTISFNEANHRCEFNPQTTTLKFIDTASGQQFSASLLATDNTGTPCAIKFTQLIACQANALGTELKLSGKILFNQPNQQLNVTGRFKLYNSSSRVNASICIANPQAAIHRQGFWDLGDPHSVLFNSFSLNIQADNFTNSQIKPMASTNWFESRQASISLQQVSSGGENWNSANHVDHNNQQNLPFCGYQLTVDEQSTRYSARALPLLFCQTSQAAIGVSIEKFWQNFPSQLACQQDHISIGLFPEGDQTHELQPGERKTQHFAFDFSGKPEALASLHSPVTPRLDYAYYAQADALDWLAATSDNDELSPLIEQGLSSSNNFYNKREQQDEFGWRHFGDLFADHESLYRQAEQSAYISHYNNQYDPIYGFARQYLISGDQRWFELMNDLAQHVVDIDIYNTDQDRDEYNGGLFWHTDHYLDAYTSGHRTYSIKQLHDLNTTNHGGGPGGQHGYTTGLLTHYLLTGNDASKEAVFTLSHWLSQYYEGGTSILGFLLAFKNRHFPGYKNTFSGGHQYPFDRGTANYIVALLDSYSLSNNPTYLAQVEHIIANTVHPNDDISQRQLNDVETTWFYTIFFQAVLRYLLCKERLNTLDQHYYFALDSFLHYAQWMLTHEAPYLDKPEILDYPNITWAAQDIRKANLLYAAYHYTNQQTQYREKAEQFYQYVCSALAADPNSQHTRILALLMQNHGQKHYYDNKPVINPTAAVRHYANAPQHKHYHTPLLFINGLCKKLISFSWQRETEWINKRRGTYRKKENAC